MADQTKPNEIEPKPEAKAPEVKAAEAPQQPAPAAAEPQGAAPATPPDAGKPAAEAKPAVKVERPANCVACNKSIKKQWYYRNGKYYCTKGCWQTTSKKEKAPKEGESSEGPK